MYNSKLRYNKIEYSIASGPYCITHGMKVPFSMLGFSAEKVLHIFYTLIKKKEINTSDMI